MDERERERETMLAALVRFFLSVTRVSPLPSVVSHPIPEPIHPRFLSLFLPRLVRLARPFSRSPHGRRDGLFLIVPRASFCF